MSEGSHSRVADRHFPLEADAQKRAGLFNRLLSLVRVKTADETFRETIGEIVDDIVHDMEPSSAQPMDPAEQQILKNILSRRDVTVYDVMTPRSNMIAVPAEASFDDAMKILCDAAHSRLPVYRETLDDVVGMLHIKDVLIASRAEPPAGIETLLREVLFVPPSTRVVECLMQMRGKRIHLAMVVDEYGGIDGLVTIEDLMEQIVGEIEDEHDEHQEPPIVQAEDGSFLFDARVSVEDLERETGLRLTAAEKDDVDTAGGLVASLAGRVPAAGDLVPHPPSGMVFEVLEAAPHRIEKLRLRPAAEAAPSL